MFSKKKKHKETLQLRGMEKKLTLRFVANFKKKKKKGIKFDLTKILISLL